MLGAGAKPGTPQVVREEEGARLCVMLPLAVVLGACHREPSGPRTAFDGQAALALVKTQLDFGPRVPGTPAHTKEGDWIVSEMKPLADTVIEQRWVHVTAHGDSLPMRNILARFRPQDPNRVLYLTHWDTRPVSDGSADTAQWKLPIPGANDGASGVAMFIALASLFSERKVRTDTAMTGEISLRGLVLPVGGIKEKVLAAMRAGINRVTLPARNRKDLEEVPDEAKPKLEFVFLEDVDDAVPPAIEPGAGIAPGASPAET